MDIYDRAYLKAHPEYAHLGRTGFHDDCLECMSALKSLQCAEAPVTAAEAKEE